MNVIEAIQTRKSVRNYRDRPVEAEKLNSIMEAARLAPSASNRQEWRFIIVQDETLKNRLMEAANGQKMVGNAPVVIAACALTDNHVMRCGQACYPIDVAIALDHITLAAVFHGLGTCWIGSFNEKSVKKILGIPEEVRVVELMTLGYPVDPSPAPKRRLSIDEIVMYETWSG